MEHASAAKKAVKWDEAQILEHDRERGTRMKIDEPPTPYVHPTLGHASATMSEDNEIEKEILNDFSLNDEDSVGHFSLGNSSTSKMQNDTGNDSDSEAEDFDKLKAKRSNGKLGFKDEDNENGKENHNEFAQARKAHYNEYAMLRKWREKIDDDEEEEGANNNKGKVSASATDRKIENGKSKNDGASGNKSPTKGTTNSVISSSSSKAEKKSVSLNQSVSIKQKSANGEAKAVSATTTKKENYSTLKPERKVKLDGNR